MARKFQSKNKDLVKLSVVPHEEVWDKSKLDKNGKPTLRRDIEIFGKVQKGTSTFVTSSNLRDRNHKFIEDTGNLPKKVKNEIVNLFKNDKRIVAWLVKKK
jgi:hypothetical protein